MEKHQELAHLKVFKRLELHYFAPCIVFLFLYGKLLRSKFGLIDDHEFFSFFGGSTRTPITDFMYTLLSKTEVGLWGDHERFRPSYHAVRVIETIVFGRNSTLFYLTHLTLALVFLVTTLNLVKSNIILRVDTRAQGLFIIYAGFTFATLPALQDILTRLGPAEIYLIATIPTIIHLSVKGILDKLSSRNFALIHLLIIFAIGSKENAIILVSLAVVLFWKQVHLKNVTLTQTLLHTVTVSWALFCFLGPAITIRTNGGNDYYGEKRSISNSLKNLGTISSDRALLYSLILILLLFVLAKYLKKDNVWPNPRTLSFILIVLVIRMFESVVYGGTISYDLSRYSILKQVMDTLLILATFAMTVNFLLSINTKKRYLRKSLILIICLVFVLTTFKGPQSLIALENKVNKSVKFTTDFDATFSKILDFSLKDTNLLIFVTQPYDYEPLYSMQQYLKAELPGSRSYLVTNFEQNENIFELGLLEQMKNWKINGNADLNISPLSSFRLSKRQICIMFDKKQEDIRCEKTFIFLTDIL
jgi:hypothetical protein